MGLLPVAALDAAGLVGDWTDGLAGDEVGSAWVAVVPQAKTSITIAINSNASSRDISGLSPTV